jgi:hypothetical protein
VSSSGSDQPFVFDRPLDTPDALIGRDQHLAALAGALAQGSDAVVVGPHRHGKTSVVNAALAEFASTDGCVALRVDCGGVLTVADFVRRVQDAYAAAWANGPVEDSLLERLDAVSFLLTGAEAGSSVRRLEAVLDVVGDVAGSVDARAVVALDEVQDALAVPEIVDALRAAGERGADRVGWMYVGPELSSADGSLSGARAQVVEVGALDPGMFAVEVTRRFADTGRDAGEAAQVIAAVGSGHPQRSSLLAAQLWELTPTDFRATVLMARMAIDNALVRCAPEFEVRWDALHGNERRVVVAIANGIAPQGTRAQRATGLASVSAAQRALQGIKASGVARAEEDQTTLTDPLFAEWLRRRYPQAPPEPSWQALRRGRLERGIGHRGITR